MFTGIVEELGVVKEIKILGKGAILRIQSSKVLNDICIGDSISTNGVCLTVKEFDDKFFEVDVMEETLRKSNLSELRNGDLVNLESALTLNKKIGGHIVTGHIDGIGKIKSIYKEGEAVWYEIQVGKDILKYIVIKGSIAIDGISLTVAYEGDNSFKVSLIPHTLKETVLSRKKIGNRVNLECDVLGKYVEKILKCDNNKSNINEEFLSMNGFM